MNYKESKEILEKIKGSKRILVNCHRIPDGDSLGSALALEEFLVGLGKQVDVVCPDEISDSLSYVLDYGKVRTVDFGDFDFSNYDVFFVLDTSGWEQLGADLSLNNDLFIVVVDHHQSNSRFGKINLMNENAVSTAEIVLALMDDWKVDIGGGIASKLLAGIVCDSGAFQFPSTNAKTLEDAARLMRLGGDLRRITDGMFRNLSFTMVKFLGLSLKNVQIDNECKYVWSYVGFDDFGELNFPEGKSKAAAMFFQNVRDTDFGFLVVEEDKNSFNVSFRARADWVDSSELAGKFGGGGHKAAAGARFQEVNLEKALERIHGAVREYVEKHKKRNK